MTHLYDTLLDAAEAIDAASTLAEAGDLYLAARNAFYAADDLRPVNNLQRAAWGEVLDAFKEAGERLATPVEPLVVLA